MLRNGPQTVADYGSRRKRRNAVKSILACVSAVRDAEQNYLENVPDNLQNSESFELGESAVDTFEEVISLLAEVY
jgi:hypothetical protein